MPVYVSQSDHDVLVKAFEAIEEIKREAWQAALVDIEEDIAEEFDRQWREALAEAEDCARI